MFAEMDAIRWERQCKKGVDTRFPDLFVYHESDNLVGMEWMRKVKGKYD